MVETVDMEAEEEEKLCVRPNQSLLNCICNKLILFSQFCFDITHANGASTTIVNWTFPISIQLEIIFVHHATEMVSKWKLEKIESKKKNRDHHRNITNAIELRIDDSGIYERRKIVSLYVLCVWANMDRVNCRLVIESNYFVYIYIGLQRPLGAKAELCNF